MFNSPCVDLQQQNSSLLRIDIFWYIILSSFCFVYDVVIKLNLSCFFRCKIQHWFLFLKSSICLMTERWAEWQLQMFADKVISNLSLNWCFTLEDEYLADPVEGDNTMNSSTSGFTATKKPPLKLMVLLPSALSTKDNSINERQFRISFVYDQESYK